MIFREIKFTGAELQNYSVINSTENNVLNNLSKINIFVGQNNSGKSRLLRNISKIEEYEFLPLDVDHEKNRVFIDETVSEITTVLNRYSVTTLGDVNSILLPSVQPNSFYKYAENPAFRLQKLLNYISTQDFNSVQRSGGDVHSCAEALKVIAANKKDVLGAIVDEIKEKESGRYKRMYIPILRGLRPTRRGEHNVNDYHDRTSFDYFENSIGDGNKYSDNLIFTGLELYESIRKRLLGTLTERKLVRDFEIFLSENFFEKKQVTLIPSHNADVLTITIGDIEKKIFDLGDGIQSLIILNYPIFEFVRNNPQDSLCVFIEEPELYIHPGLQRKLLERWDKSEYDKVQFFITTHSNHFLDMTIDFSNISIFRVVLDKFDVEKRENVFKIENLSSDDKNLLETLGVRNSSVFLSNSTIWVEGISDRIYIRKYLEMYLKKIRKVGVFKEDVHYSFIEYGGGNLPHWSFDTTEDSSNETIRVDSIVSKIFLVADRDDTNTNPQSSKATRLKKLKRLLGAANLFIANAREIENIISWSVLKRTIEARGDILKSKLKDDVVQKNLLEKPLGQYIETKLLESSPKRKYKVSTSGTINNKPAFANEVCEQIESFDDLSPEAKKLTRAIYRFIVTSNTK